MFDELRADYDQLDNVANRFANQASQIQDMLQRVRGGMESLEEGWIGRGSEAFFSEMQSEVLPASMRLQQALQEASQVTKQIVQTVRQAEDQASSLFRGR